MKGRARRVALIFLGLMCLLLATLALVTWSVVRQEQLNQALIDAVKRNDDRAVVSLLSLGADANCRDEPPRKFSWWETLKQVFRGRQSLPSHGRTALMLALNPQPDEGGSSRENLPLVRALVDHGARVNQTDEDGLTPLSVAINFCKSDTARLLLARGAKLQEDDLGRAITAHVGQNVIEDILDHGADVHARTTDTYPNGLPAICMHDESPAIIRLLLARGAKVNERADDGATLVMVEAMYGRVTGIRFGLDHGVDVNARDQDGSTALIYAIEGAGDPNDSSKSVEAVKMLLARGADVNVRTWREHGFYPAGSTALHMARSFFDQRKNETPPTTNKGLIQIIHLLKAAGARK